MMATKKSSKTSSKSSGKSSGTIYRQGDSGSTIKNTQQALADRGLLSQKDVTGTYDKTTAKAIKTFKTNTNGSNTYGNTFGHETLKKLFNSSGSSFFPAAVFSRISLLMVLRCIMFILYIAASLL